MSDLPAFSGNVGISLLAESEKTREVYWGLTPQLLIFWYVLSVAAIVVFSYGAIKLYAKYRRGKGPDPLPLRALPRRLVPTLAEVFSHRRIGRRDGLVKWAHRGILFGFTVLFIGTVLVAINTDITKPLFGWDFLSGDFYLVYKFFLNVFGIAFIVGVIAMMFRRGVSRPAKLDYTPQDPDGASSARKAHQYMVGDWTFVLSLLFIAITGYALQGVRIAMDDPGYNLALFGGLPFAWFFDAILSDSGLVATRHFLWWLHGVVSIVWFASIPFTKASHMLTGIASLALRRPAPVEEDTPDPRSEQEPGENGESAGPSRGTDAPASFADTGAPGYKRISDLSPLHLLQVDSCTKCGKCHEACPARATGRPLSPRDVVLELREQSNTFLGAGFPSVIGAAFGRSSRGALCESDLVGDGLVGEEALWSCTQCNACVEICPVGIEQAPIINLMRQSRVDEGNVAPELQNKFETIREVGNSFGVAPEGRAEWTKQVPELTITDAREKPVDVLWFVGDHAAFDPQAQKVALSLARVLTAAGVDFGILYDGERNSGNDVQAAGEVGLFEQLVSHNVATISECRFNRIMTSDPHSFNALRKAYPDFGGRWTVLHHTQLLLELIDGGQLDVSDTLHHRVTYHDPCFLGRHNGVYDPPREILRRLGCELVEMPRNRDNSFCCGAGGGRIWMKDPVGLERPADNRIKEAATLGVELYVVACPKDVIMYEAAIRDTGHADDLTLRELTQLIEEAVSLRKAETVAAGVQP